MSKTRLSSGIAIAALGLLSLAARTAISPPPATGDLGGVWRTEVQPDPRYAMPQVVDLTVMTHDGDVVNLDPAGSGVGKWKKLQDSQHAIVFHGFLTLGGQQVRFQGAWPVALNQTGSEFAGPFVTDVSDLSGARLFSFSGVVRASRLELESL